MNKSHMILGAALGVLVLLASPASAALVTVTLSGSSEQIRDNAGVFGYGAGQILTDKNFVETFVLDTSAVNFFGPQTATGVSSNSIFGGSPPYAVGGTLTINGISFSTIGSNFSSLFTVGDYQILSNDMVDSSVDNMFYVDLTGSGLPTTVTQAFSTTLAADQIGNVSFVDNKDGGNVSAAIGNLFPTQFTVVPAAAAVPEPMTWVMMMLGFGVVGHLLRAGRKPKAQAGRPIAG